MATFLKSMFGRQSLEDKLNQQLQYAALLVLKSEDAYEFARAMLEYHKVRVDQLRRNLTDIRSAS